MKGTSTTEYILKKWSLDPESKLPIHIPDTDRQALAVLFHELGFKRGAEIGVKNGEYSEVLLKSIPGLTLYSVDPWKYYKTVRDFRKQSDLDEYYANAVARLAPYKNCIIIKKSSMDALSDIEDGSLDFVYIDADHEFSHVVADIAGWSNKVRKGGIVSGHDYHLSKDPESLMHVPFALHGYTEAHKIKPWYVLGRKETLPGELRDKQRSWMWVKS